MDFPFWDCQSFLYVFSQIYGDISASNKFYTHFCYMIICLLYYTGIAKVGNDQILREIDCNFPP